MSRKAIRVLAVLAFSLYAAAMIFSALAVTVFRTFILQLSGAFESPHLFAAAGSTPVPAAALFVLFMEFGVSLTLMILAFRLRTDPGSRVAVIVLAILLAIFRAMSYPLSIAQNLSVAHSLGAESLAVMSAMNGTLSVIETVLSVPANILMLLAMGGFCGRAGRLCEAALPESDNSLQGGTSE